MLTRSKCYKEPSLFALVYKKEVEKVAREGKEVEKVAREGKKVEKVAREGKEV